MKQYIGKRTGHAVEVTVDGAPLEPLVWNCGITVRVGLNGAMAGDVVLDPFGGSGTTAVAAKMCGRQFILIEKLTRYFEAAHHRVVSL